MIRAAASQGARGTLENTKEPSEFQLEHDRTTTDRGVLCGLCVVA